MSAVLLVLFIVVLQMGFVLVGGQAGRLFDVQQIKARFPRIVSGFAAGLMAGGLLGPPILALTGRAEDLLAGAALAGLVFLAAVVGTGRRYPRELALVPQPANVPRPPLRALLGKRFVVAILVYQVFSAMGSQLLDWMVFDRAAAIYTGAEELARVISIFTAVLNGANLLFLALFAGSLLRRFGLRLGVNANPMLVSALVATIALAALGGAAATVGLFLFVAASRIADITLSDGMTRTSINATYQALPLRDRLAVQATVEGVGVPIAIGSTGVILIVASALGLGFTFIALTSLALCLVWTAAGLALYRGYRARLVASLRQRVVEPAALTLDGPTLGALDGLLASDDDADVRLALDTLAAAEDGKAGALLRERLDTLAADPRPARRAEALRRLATLPAGVGQAGSADHARTAAIGRAALDDPAPDVRAAAVALLARRASPDDADAIAIARLADDPDRGVAVAALLAGLDATGPTSRDARSRLTGLAASPDVAERRRLAQALATMPAGGRVASPESAASRMAARESPAGPSEHRARLIRILLADPDPAVRVRALAAAGADGDPSLLADVIRCAADGTTVSAAAAALPGFGAALLARLDEGLALAATEPDATAAAKPGVAAPVLARLVAAAAHVGGAEPVLANHARHPDPTLRLAVLRALVRQRLAVEAGPPGVAAPAPGRHPSAGAATLAAAAEAVAAGGRAALRAAPDPAVAGAAGDALALASARGAAALTAIGALAGAPGTTHVVRALRDEVDEAASTVAAALALRHDPRAIEGAVRAIRHGTEAERGVALEMLEVSLPADESRAALALLTPDLDDDARRAGLERTTHRMPMAALGAGAPDPGAILAELACDPDRAWRRSWLRVAAIHAAGAGGHAELVPLGRELLADEDPDVAATAAWALERLGAS